MPFANLTNFTTHAITIALPIFSTHHFRGLCTTLTSVKSEELLDLLCNIDSTRQQKLFTYHYK